MKKLATKIKPSVFRASNLFDERAQSAVIRVSVMLMITALLLPLMIIQPLTKVTAKSNNSSFDPPAPTAAPPNPFIVSGSENGGGYVPVVISSIVSSGYSSVAGFFTTPQLPDEFSAAHPVSPVSSFFSSVGASFGNIFGLFASSSATVVEYMPPSAGGSQFDFDGDGKADPAVRHQFSGVWNVKQSSTGNGISTDFGAAAAFMTPGDFDGDSITDYAIFHNGTWAIRSSSTQADGYITLGAAGDRPMVGDYDGDGKTDAAVFRPSNGTWYIQRSTAGYTSFQFGIASDVLVPGDYDGDGKTDIAVFRPADQLWYIQGSSAGFYSVSWGLSSDVQVPGDYDGDNKTDFAVWRPSTGTWYILKSSSTSGGYLAQAWGNYSDQPIPADYDGDGKIDLAVWRPKTGVWHILKSSDNGYVSHTLGLQNEKLVEAAYLKQVGSSAFDYTFARTRLSPKNATGGTNLYSQNFGWGSGLVGLSGRNGLDAGFGIGYNSLVWIKHNNTMIFDPDNSNITPGFGFGFPVIEPVYYDGTLQKYAYMMVTPSGNRVEFRQTLASNVYETADSSYLQLVTNGASNPNDPVDNIGITIRGTDGTQMSYEWKGNSYKLKEVKDRNGNFITIVHDNYGLLRTVTDTLGRVITVGYDGNNLPTNITQQWNAGNGNGAAVNRTYATFEYTTRVITPSFAADIGVFGPQGLQTSVLAKIIFGDAANNTGETRFAYNNFGQVQKIENYARDGHRLNYAATNLETPGTLLTDVPRLTQTRSWVENFNGVGGRPPETVINNALYPGQQVTDLDGATVAATAIQVQMANHPHGNITNSYVGASGWMEGLPITTNDFTNEGGLQLRRSSWTKWTQDDPNAALINNPRVTASKIGDNVSSKKTVIDYKMQGNTTISDHGLVSEVRLYDGGNNNAQLKRSTTSYNEDAAYLSRRIIGLPLETNSYGLNQETQTQQHISKTTYAYDEGNFSDTALQQTIAPIQHDAANYGASFIIGRANPTSTTSYEVPSGSGTIRSEIKYNTAGAPVASVDPMGRQSKIIYEDKFNLSPTNRNTFAYPTKLIDPAGNSSEVNYRYDIGANVWAKSPAPAGNTTGKETARIYDALGRLEKETLVNTGAYTRYEYPANAIQSKVYTTIEDTNGNGADAADEVMSESLSDGAGRTLRSRTLLPISGGADTWSGTLVEYDILGRVARSSVPTEISINQSTGEWTPAGDDAGRGWLWTSQKYDWKSRVIEKTNTDGTFQTISYDGCGCAGGQTTTIKGEEIFETAWGGTNPVSLGRRTQKIYADVLGRTKMTEILDWNGSVYSATVPKYDGRDQVYSVTKYAGGEDAGNAHQETTIGYDGFGRTKTRHRPEQVSANNTPTYTSYNYYADGSISSVVDARGATTNYSYNSRGLADSISYGVPSGSTIPVTPSVTFTYDNAGNRTKMTDGLGTVDYTYTNLSQLKTEKRTFSDTLADAPAGGNAFLLSYDYTLSGQLKYITDPYGQQFNYAYDKVGRLQSVAGATAFDGISTYASNPTYNARGTLTSLQYGNGVSMNITGFNNKLQATGFEVKKGANKYIDKEYKFYEDGSLKFVDDGLDERFDRSYKYDAPGRTTQGKAGIAARGGSSTDQNKLDQPYSMQYTHDAFGHITSKTGYYYQSPDNTYYSYDTNNRNPLWSYDADGNTVSDDDATYTYDAAGRIVKTNTTADYLDGDGKLLKRVTNAGSTDPAEEKYYFIRSSVLNKVISEPNHTGRKYKTYVSANGTTLATQTVYVYNGTVESLTFNHTDASGTGAQTTRADGLLSGSGNTSWGRTAEYSPLGRNVADAGPYITLTTYEDPGQGGVNMFGSGQGYRPGQTTYRIDGMVVPESQFMDVINSGLIGGAFGLLEMAARMSTRIEKYNVESGFWFEKDGGASGPPSFSSGRTPIKNYGYGYYKEQAITGYGYRITPIYNSNWSGLAAIAPKAQQKDAPRPLNDKEKKSFDEGRNKARETLQNSERCRNAIANILKADTLFPFLPDHSLVLIGGEVLRFSPINDFVYDSNDRRSGYLETYDSITMMASGMSGQKGNSVTYGVSNRKSRNGIFLEAPITWNREFFKLGERAMGLHILHEILHQYASDVHLADIIAGIRGDRENGNIRTFTDVGTASRYINDHLSEECNLPLN